MAEDQCKQEEDKFEFTTEGEAGEIWASSEACKMDVPAGGSSVSTMLIFS